MIDLFETAWFLRAFEDEIAGLSTSGHTPGLVHLSNGAEILHAAVGARLKVGMDLVTASHRCHTVALVAGADPARVAAEICGLPTGLNGGFAGTQHLAAGRAGFLTATGIVGSQVPLAAGAALAALRRGAVQLETALETEEARTVFEAEMSGKASDTAPHDRIAVAFLGEGAVNQGAVLETLNLAAIQHLPLLLVIENNGIAQSTVQSHSTAGTVVNRLRTFGFAASTATVYEPRNLCQQLDHLVGWARAGHGPAAIEVAVPRLCGHYHGASFKAGADEEAQDPLAVWEDRLRAQQVPASILVECRQRSLQRARRVMTEMWQSAGEKEKGATTVSLGAAKKELPDKPSGFGEQDTESDLKQKDCRFNDAVKETLKRAMTADARIFLMGEDIAAPDSEGGGGVFGATKGLLDIFGPQRVMNTPISESAFLGQAVGAAMAGLRPVVEIMFCDFLAVCMDPLLSQAAKARFVTNGVNEVPLIVRTTMGAGDGSGAVHSQSLHALLASIAGLRVAVPSCPQTAADVLVEAFQSPDPVIIFEHKALYGTSGPVEFAPPSAFLRPKAAEGEAVAAEICSGEASLGGAAWGELAWGELGRDVSCLRRKGSDITIVALGAMVTEALNAASKLAAHGVSAAVIDPVWVSPLPLAPILESVAETGRLLVVDEGSAFAGFADALISRVSQAAFADLKQAPAALTPPHTPVPYAPAYEAEWIIKAEKIEIAVLDMMGKKRADAK